MSSQPSGQSPGGGGVGIGWVFHLQTNLIFSVSQEVGCHCPSLSIKVAEQMLTLKDSLLMVQECTGLVRIIGIFPVGV